VRVGLKTGEIDLQVIGPEQARLAGHKPPLLTAD
jgi:ATP-dependent Clp protease ATP-binding subunit ClpA